jgi:pyrimidine operon attenuation protein/uracil phosphoribosyltransferase
MAGHGGDALPQLPDAVSASVDDDNRAQPAHGWARPRLELLGPEDLGRTLDRLASQVLEKVPASSALVLLGIPTRGVALARVLAERVERLCGHPIACGSLDPTFHRDDLARVGTRMVQPTQLPVGIDEAEVVLVDDVIFTGRTVRAALEALQTWGRPRRVHLVAMVDRGHRELPIQPDFCGRVVPTTRQESIQVCLQAIDGEEGVFLLRPDGSPCGGAEDQA